ncbi:uncharacterized protein MYCFIDRAFT_87189 [Pseudocercospora fijiensis CIRAD86]|uniref:Uncharacterized protein n=1 Tax=Pseudocercospora fijiensis (strain CIRAD86) TaxID=383855 RepID=M3AK08_PSEFD|nr:uncharacterized protein MYCFIDRAFT_87189 [Pseudocercospora fijiensis CIRAD86]EME77772.1 hypothetical protein MYCFIDRAFT_87189 [Pseudocercospora fijiensis CIRAD86]
MPKIKAVLFDFVGTCLDWHATIVEAMPQSIPHETGSQLALDWRHTYFKYNEERRQKGLPPEDIDTSHRNTLPLAINNGTFEAAQLNKALAPAAIDRLIQAWHEQKAWPDTKPAIEALKQKGYEVFVHANGTTRLQLDLCRASSLQFHNLFSSQLLGYIKPDPKSYYRLLELLKLEPEECAMVAAHGYDTRGAKEVGMKTIYIDRVTDDVDQDKEGFRQEFDLYLEGMSGLVEGVEGMG